jgi:hypothetical protein
MALAGMVFVLCDVNGVGRYAASSQVSRDNFANEVNSHAKWKDRTRQLRANVDALLNQMGQPAVADWHGINAAGIDVAMNAVALLDAIRDLRAGNAAYERLGADIAAFIRTVIEGVRAAADDHTAVHADGTARLLNDIAGDLEANLPHL